MRGTCQVGLDLPGAATQPLMNSQVLAGVAGALAPSGCLTVDEGTLLGWKLLSVFRGL